MLDNRLLISEPGIYNIDEAIYHADPCILPSLSSSGAKMILSHSPFHFWFEQEKNKNILSPSRAQKIHEAFSQAPAQYLADKESLIEKKSPALKLGSAAHMALLEPDRFKKTYHITPKGFVRAHHKKWKDEIAELEAAEALGRIELPFTVAVTVENLMWGMERNKDVLKKFMAAPKEQSAFWFDKTFQIWRRARFDFFPVDGHRIYADYKTIAPREGGMTDKAIEKNMASYGYCNQADWYLDAVRALDLNDDPVFCFIFQETLKGPHEIAIRNLDASDMADAKMQNAKAMDLFAEALDTGYWPSYDLVKKEASKMPTYKRMEIDAARERGDYELTYKIKAQHYYEGCEKEENQ